MTEPSFTIGIEEEYLLVDLETRDGGAHPPEDLLAEGVARTDGLMTTEFLQSQLEVGTRKCSSVSEAAAEIVELRSVLSDLAGEYGNAVVAASTHPFGAWESQELTHTERYEKLDQDHQVVARRMLICGMHVHVGLDDDDLRIDLMRQASYFLPHILALSTSSPFWHGTNTGLRSYRLTVFDGMPRTGLPEVFESWGDYQRHVAVQVEAGVIADASDVGAGLSEFEAQRRTDALQLSCSPPNAKPRASRPSASCTVRRGGGAPYPRATPQEPSTRYPAIGIGTRMGGPPMHVPMPIIG